MVLLHRCGFALFMLLLSVGFLAPAAAQTDPLRESTSLKFVPADASFYYSRLRMKEQYDAFVNSVGWTKFAHMPAIKMLRDMMNAPPDFPELPTEGIPDLKEFWAAPENKVFANLLWELVSDEAFVYGDIGFAESYEVFQELGKNVNQLEGGTRLNDEILAVIDKWKIPNALIGFKVKDPKRAEAQLARLEKLITDQLAAHEELAEVKKRFTRTKIGGSEFLAIQLDGSLIPWDQSPAEMEEQKKEVQQLRERLSKKTLAVYLGVHQGYLLVALGPSDEHLRKLGQGPLLVDKPELAPLKKFAGKPFYSLGFISERFLKSANNTDVQIDNYVKVAEQLLRESELDAETQRELQTDIRDLGADFKKSVPKPGNYLSFGFLTPRGTEGYAYDWGEQSLEGSGRLSILDHVGGKPLFFTAGRAKYNPGLYEMRVKWFGRAVYWAERFAVPLLEPEQATAYEKIRRELQPLIVRLDVAIKAMWIPAFKDGQSAWVVDAKTTSSKWIEGMPEPKKPLPFLEFGTAASVSDAGLLKQAAGEFYDIAQQTLNVLNSHFPAVIEKTEIPAPKSREFPEGTIYYYPAPEEAGADRQFAPNAGLSKDTLALSLIPKFSLRLLKPTPLAFKEGPLASADKPLAHAMFLDVAGIVDTFGVWIDYGFENSAAAAAGLEAPDVDKETLQSAHEQVQIGMDLLKCLRSISSVSFAEGGAP